jgi:hypothetical protein
MHPFASDHQPRVMLIHMKMDIMDALVSYRVSNVLAISFNDLFTGTVQIKQQNPMHQAH